MQVVRVVLAVSLLVGILLSTTNVHGQQITPDWGSTTGTHVPIVDAEGCRYNTGIMFFSFSGVESQLPQYTAFYYPESGMTIQFPLTWEPLEGQQGLWLSSHNVYEGVGRITLRNPDPSTLTAQTTYSDMWESENGRALVPRYGIDARLCRVFLAHIRR